MPSNQGDEMTTLPVGCKHCGNDCMNVFDHDEDCEFAQREAKRQIDRLKGVLGTPWETDDTQDEIDRYREFLGEDE